MEVMYWQLVVAGSTAGAYLFISRKASMIAAGFWSFWTLIMLFYAPLIMLQLAVAWGTFFVIDSMKRTKQKLSDLEKATEQYSPSVQDAARDAKRRGSIESLRDERHYHHLLHSIESAKRSLLVLSGWISTSVIDRELVRALESAVNRGVNVYIGFGYEDSSGRHQANPKSEKALEALVTLSNRCRGSSGKIVVGRFNKHQKILIKDEVEVVCGSHNWLSNRTFINREQSLVVNDSKLAKKAFAEFRPTIESRSIV